MNSSIVSQKMSTKLANGETTHAINFYRLNEALKSGNELPPLESFGSFGPFDPYANMLYRAFKEKGELGKKDALKSIINLKRKTDEAIQAIKIISGAPPEEEPTPVGTLLSDVVAEKIDWLWKPRLALGKMTILDGDPGLGKSNITLDLAARVTHGYKMPDEVSGRRGGVVLITPEDGLADTIQPRLARAGADLSKIVAIGTIPTIDPNTGFEYNRPFTLPDDLPLLQAAIERVNAKLVIIDPVMAILGSKDTYKDNEVRAILSPVQMLIEKTHTACIMVRHLTKGGGENALYRGGGSMAFIALARSSLMVVKDPIDDSRCVFAHIKSNINKLAPSLTYNIVSDEDNGDDRPYVVWGEISTLSANDLLATPRKNTGGNRQEIIQLLQEHKPNDLSIAEISESLPDMSMTNLKTTLKRMYDKSEIGKSERGAYHAL